MIHDPPADIPPGVFAPRAAFRVGLALIAAIALVLVLSIMAHSHRSEDETHEEVTAVGDQFFFKIPEGFPKPVDAAVVFQGQSWLPIYKRITNRDSTMIRVGQDESKTYWIYTEHPTGKAASENPETTGAFYLKVTLDEYVELKPKPSEGGPSSKTQLPAR